MKQSRHERGIVPTQSEPIQRIDMKGFGNMTSAVKFHADGNAGALPARLRPAGIHASKVLGQAAGPFDVPAATDNGTSLREALVTGLLVIYPTVATVVAIIAGLFLASANGT